MKRQIFRLICLVLAAVLVFSLCSCTKGKKQHTPYNIAMEILELCSDDIEMVALSSKQTASYFGISQNYFTDFTVYVSSLDDKHDTVAVFSYSDNESRTAIADSVAQYIKTRETTALAVNDTEYNKLQNRIVMELGNNFIFVISDNFEQILAMLEKLGAKKF